MARYLYNGVELPALPAWDKEKYPYAYIELTHVNDSGIIPYTDRFELRVFSSYEYKTTTNGTDTIYCEAENSLQWKIPVDENDEPTTSEWGSYEATSEYVSLNWLVWSNFDIFARDGMTVWFSASDPVPVEPEQPETDLTNIDLYRKINGKPTKLTLYKKVGGKLIPLDEHTKEVKT